MKVSKDYISTGVLFLTLLGYILGQSALALLALLYAGLKWPFVLAAKAITPRRVVISAREVGHGC